MAVSKESIRKLVKRAEQVTVQVDDFYSEENFKDNFILSMLYRFGVRDNKEALEYCKQHGIASLTDLLEYVSRDLWS